MTQSTTHRADLWLAPALFALGAASLYGGWTMDRLEIRQIHPASIPGLVPCILGVALMLCAGLLFAQSWAARSASGSETARSWRRCAAAAALCVVYALGLVGAVPFPLATGLFIFAFIAAFGIDRTAPRAVLIRRAVPAAIVAAAVAVGISALFRYGFLVRLP